MKTPVYTPTEHRIHALANQLIAEHGVYAPIDLLLADGRLSHTAYQAWRAGETPPLSTLISCTAQRANALLTIAANWARELGLLPQPLRYACWRGDALGQSLPICSADSALDASLLGSAFYPAPSAQRRQGDLFLDSPVTIAINQLRRSLLARNAAAGRAAWQRLRRHSPEHDFLRPADELLDRLNPADMLRGNVEANIQCVQSLEADTHTWLGKAATRDIFTPHWLYLAHTLDATHFEPDRPLRHPAWIYARVGDWDACCQAVRACVEHPRHVTLMALLSSAEFSRQQRVAGLQELCTMVWSHPQNGSRQWENLQQIDHAVAMAWQRLDETQGLSFSDLPALLLIAERGLARHIGANADAPPSYGATRALCLHRGAGAQALQLRKRLQLANPILLSEFLRAMEAHTRQ